MKRLVSSSSYFKKTWRKLRGRKKKKTKFQKFLREIYYPSRLIDREGSVKNFKTPKFQSVERTVKKNLTNFQSKVSRSLKKKKIKIDFRSYSCRWWRLPPRTGKEEEASRPVWRTFHLIKDPFGTHHCTSNIVRSESFRRKRNSIQRTGSGQTGRIYRPARNSCLSEINRRIKITRRTDIVRIMRSSHHPLKTFPIFTARPRTTPIQDLRTGINKRGIRYRSSGINSPRISIKTIDNRSAMITDSLIITTSQLTITKNNFWGSNRSNRLAGIRNI